MFFNLWIELLKINISLNRSILCAIPHKDLLDFGIICQIIPKPKGVTIWMQVSASKCEVQLFRFCNNLSDNSKKLAEKDTHELVNDFSGLAGFIFNFSKLIQDFLTSLKMNITA